MNIRPFLPTVLLSLVATSLVACGSDSGGADETPDFTISADTAASTTLGTSTDIHLKLRSTGFAGPVTLAVQGLPDSWSASIPASPVDLAAGDSATVTATITIPSNGAAAAGGQALSIQATAGDLAHSAGTQLTVQNEYVVHLLLGGASGAHWAAAAHGQHLNVGTTLTVKNDDTTSHIIHSNITALGFPHQETGGVGIIPGGTFSAELTSVGSGTIACHTHSHTDTLGVSVP